MSKLCVRSFAVSIDGYGAGPSQDRENPLGVGGPELMEWVFQTLLWSKALPESAPGFSVATCSVLFEAPGRMRAGRAGGVRSRRITRLSLC